MLCYICTYRSPHPEILFTTFPEKGWMFPDLTVITRSRFHKGRAGVTRSVDFLMVRRGGSGNIPVDWLLLPMTMIIPF